MKDKPLRLSTMETTLSLVTLVITLVLFTQPKGSCSHEFEDEQSQIRLSGETELLPNPIEKLFGSGYICLHISDPKYASSPAFQALARELSKQYNKPLQVHEVGSNKTVRHEHLHEDTIVVDVQEPVTKRPPPKAGLIKQKAAKCSTEGYFVDPNNCSRYYRCYYMGPAKGGSGKQMTKTFYDCGPGTMFNEKVQACDHPISIPKNQKCVKPVEPEPEDDKGLKGLRGEEPEPEEIDQTHSEPPDDGEQSPDQTVDQWVPQLPEDGDIEKVFTAPESEDNEDIEQITEQVEEPTCTAPGSFPHPTICKKWFQCVRISGQLQMIVHDCASGTYYVPELDECKPKSQIPNDTPCMRRGRREHVDIDEQTSQILDYEEASPSEHVDSEESSFITKEVHTPAQKHRNRTKTIIETETESIEEGQNIPGRRGGRRRKIPEPAGPKPIAKCTREGNFLHPTDCSKYYRCERRGSTYRIYHSTCSPEGTIFDEKTADCKPARQLSKPIPDCAKWDKKYRKIYEDIINEETVEIDEDQVTGQELDETQTQWIDETASGDDEYEEVIVEDENGNRRKVRRKKQRVETETIDEEIIEGDNKQGTKGGKAKKRRPVNTDEPEPQEIEQVHSMPKLDDTEDESEPTSTIEPLFTQTKTWVTGEEKVDEDDKGLKGLRGSEDLVVSTTTTPTPPPDCSDDLALIEELTRERDAALERANSLEAEKDAAIERANTLESEKAKLEKQLKKAKKDLEKAIKDKQSMSDYMKNLDKTVDSYKKDVERLKLCCPNENLGVEEGDDFTVKGRKKRSIDNSDEGPNPFDKYLPNPEVKIEENQNMEKAPEFELEPHHSTSPRHQRFHPRRKAFEIDEVEIQRPNHARRIHLTQGQSQGSETQVLYTVFIFTCVLLSILCTILIGMLITNRLRNGENHVNYTLESIIHHLRDREGAKYKTMPGSS